MFSDCTAGAELSVALKSGGIFGCGRTLLAWNWDVPASPLMPEVVGTSDQALCLSSLWLCDSVALIGAYFPVYCCSGIMLGAAVGRYGVGWVPCRWIVPFCCCPVWTRRLCFPCSSSLLTEMFKIHSRIFRSCQGDTTLGLSTCGKHERRLADGQPYPLLATCQEKSSLALGLHFWV